jgi:hypothetical protein
MNGTACKEMDAASPKPGGTIVARGRFCNKAGHVEGGAPAVNTPNYFATAPTPKNPAVKNV